MLGEASLPALLLFELTKHVHSVKSQHLHKEQAIQVLKSQKETQLSLFGVQLHSGTDTVVFLSVILMLLFFG